jgi:hypothetical protein
MYFSNNFVRRKSVYFLQKYQWQRKSGTIYTEVLPFLKNNVEPQKLILISYFINYYAIILIVNN